MRLPNANLALVEREKIIEYLLNVHHPDNSGKARFFFALGFSREEWLTLANALRTLAETAGIVREMESSHGIKYIVDGQLKTPAGKTPDVRTVWILDSGSDVPRFVTAYPH